MIKNVKQKPQQNLKIIQKCCKVKNKKNNQNEN